MQVIIHFVHVHLNFADIIFLYQYTNCTILANIHRFTYQSVLLLAQKRVGFETHISLSLV